MSFHKISKRSETFKRLEEFMKKTNEAVKIYLSLLPFKNYGVYTKNAYRCTFQRKQTSTECTVIFQKIIKGMYIQM